MNFKPVDLVHVYYKPDAQKLRVGRLATKNRKIFFEYDSAFLSSGLQLSPIKLPLKAGLHVSDDMTFDGLFGVFNDSLPDGWGRLLLDRTLAKHNINPGSISVLDRLCFVGAHGMGALIYEPEALSNPILPLTSLDEISRGIAEFQRNDNDELVEDLLIMGGSSAGARPKVLLEIDQQHWLIKFPSSSDPKDIGAIEYAYHLMAKEAGLQLPLAKLFPARNSHGFFASCRFDKATDTRTHMHTISGLLHADHRIPTLDYKDILKTTLFLTQSVQECEKQFRQCVFNVLTHNRDDHAKNFSFLMDSKGVWQLSPAYDLTFSSGPNAEHCTMILGEGKNPGLSHLIELARISTIKKSKALEIVQEVKDAVTQWSTFAKRAGVSQSSTKLINSTIQKIYKDYF